MIFISYRERHSEPKGVLTLQKISKMQGIEAAFIKRANALQKSFDDQPGIKPLLAESDGCLKMLEDLIKNKNASEFWRARNTVLAESTELLIEYFEKFLQFAQKQNASYAVIKLLENRLTKAKQFLKELKRDSGK